MRSRASTIGLAPRVLVAVAACAGAAEGAAQVAPATRIQEIPGADISFTTVLVPSDAFLLGSPPDEVGRDEDEGPQGRVRLEPFYIGIHEVTASEYALFRQRELDSSATADPGRELDVDAIARPSPPYEDPAHGLGGPDRPATGMTWWAAMQYARWLSLKTGRLYRLPTEAEWEYVCRGGTNLPNADVGEGAPLADRAWYIENSGERLHAVGGRRANPLGVMDMLGNAAEWTLDVYRPDAYASLNADSTSAPWARGDELDPHVVRGGAFDDVATDLRCANRIPETPAWKRRDPQLPKSRWWNTDSPHVGFRLVSPAREWSIGQIEAFFDGVLGR